MKKAKKKWIKLRHHIVRNILYFILIPYSKMAYRVKIVPFKEQRGRQFLIVMNHQTAFDQFFVGGAFKGPVYYIASEDLFSNGFISKVIKYLVAPIPIRKQTTDVSAVRTCIRVAKEGGTIALAPEGNRTYSGRPVYINPAISSLTKALKLPLAIMRIEGGYGVHPRWSDVTRKGNMKAYVSRVIEPEEYKNLTNDELYEIIKKEMYVDETEIKEEYLSSKNAEFLERAIYVCPYCGLSKFESNGSKIKCLKCGKTVEHNADKTLSGVGFSFPFKYVADWYDYQVDFINNLDLAEEKLYFEDMVSLSEVILYKKKLRLSNRVKLSLYGNKITLDSKEISLELNFEDIKGITVLGKNKLNIYLDSKLYQIKGDKRFNALKYVNFCFRYKNILGGDENAKFLGL